MGFKPWVFERLKGTGECAIPSSGKEEVGV